MIPAKQETALMIKTDLKYVKELITSILYIESVLISRIYTMSEAVSKYKGRGLELTFKDGSKYYLSITKAL